MHFIHSIEPQRELILQLKQKNYIHSLLEEIRRKSNCNILLGLNINIWTILSLNTFILGHLTLNFLLSTNTLVKRIKGITAQVSLSSMQCIWFCGFI